MLHNLKVSLYSVSVQMLLMHAVWTFCVALIVCVSVKDLISSVIKVEIKMS